MIHRAKHEKNFLRVDNSTVRDENLTLEARGLLMFFLTMSDDWEFSVKSIAKQLGKSERYIMRLTKELKDAGYLTQEKRQDAKGHFSFYEWHVYETPELHKNRTSGNEQLGTELHKNRSAAKPNYGKMQQKELSNDKELSNSKNYQMIKEKHKRKPSGINENVLLTDKELEDLKNQLGENDAGRYIDLLSFYIKDHPETKYKSHYKTILKWHERDQKEKRPDITPLTEHGVDWLEVADAAEDIKK